MRTGEVAHEAGVNVQTLRYYERRGLLESPRRTPSGYRDYPADAVRVVRFVKRAQELGFALVEIAALLRLREADRGSRGAVRARAVERRREIERKIRSLEAIRGALTSLIDTCRRAGTTRCPILEALDGESAPPDGRDARDALA